MVNQTRLVLLNDVPTPLLALDVYRADCPASLACW
jgi:hypothetical protein